MASTILTASIIKAAGSDQCLDASLARDRELQRQSESPQAIDAFVGADLIEVKAGPRGLP